MTTPKPAAVTETKAEIRCSFCRKAQNEVGRIIAGQDVYICDGCILVCRGIIDEGAEVIAERTMELRDGETTRPVTVRIHRPEERGSGWICTTELENSREPGSLFTDEYYGDDSVGALFEALAVLRISIKTGDDMTYKGRNPWPIIGEPPDHLYSTSAPGLAADIVIERTLQTRDGQTVLFRIRKPVQRGPTEWGCVFDAEWPDGLRRREIHGTDSAQALFLALSAAKADATLDQLSHGGHNPWEVRTEPLELLPWKTPKA